MFIGRDHVLEIPEQVGDAEYRDKDRLARYLAERVLAHISGTGDRTAEDRKAVNDLPSDRYFAGTLIPSEEGELSDLSGDLQEKLTPSALEVEFRVDPDDVNTIELGVSGNVYYRSFPTYEEQTSEQHVSLGEEDDDPEGARGEDQEEFKKVYRRLRFESTSVKIPVPDADDLEPGDVRRIALQDGLGDLADDLQDRVRDLDEDDGTPPVWRAASALPLPQSIGGLQGVPEGSTLDWEDYTGEFLFPPEATDDPEVYGSLVEEIASTGDPLTPGWELDLVCEFVQKENGDLRGTLTVENVSDARADTTGYETQYGADAYDTTLFDVEAELRAVDGEFLDFTFERVEQDFRYDRQLPGHGTNCTVERVSDSVLKTRYVPDHRQRRYVTRSTDYFDEDLDTSFETLSDLKDGGIEALDRIASAMREYSENDYEAVLEEEYRPDPEFRDDDEDDFRRDWRAFQREIERFERGVECLRGDLESGPGWLVRAFELMNETFERKVTEPDGSKEYDSWYLFQIVFVLRVLPDLASRQEEYSEWAEVTWRQEDDEPNENLSGDELDALDLVDILWFPTGGGKTEAYLGLAVLNAFFDRKRGKRYGVTAWTRFPLRLLSLQQTHRVGEILMNAELLRLEESDIRGDGYMPFTLGYLVGKKNTPNQLSGYSSPPADREDYLADYLRYRDSDEAEELKEEEKVFPSCPVCGAPTSLRATDDLRLAHYCEGDPGNCRWQSRDLPEDSDYRIFERDELPVHIVDNELYRYAPTVIVGTIDKICAVGYQRKSAHLYTGRMTHWCPDHGFASAGECTEKYGCEDRYAGSNTEDDLVPLERTPLGHPQDAAPSLQIQDEMHLLKETLGTFDSHFESFVDFYQRFNGEQRTKIIGATATIEDYEKQAEQLYLRRSERFPVEGPELGENFYATTKEETQRQFVGIMPHGKTHINAVIHLVYHYTREIERIRKSVEGGDLPQLVGELGMETVHSPEDLLELLELYETSLAYTISKRDKNRFTESIRGQIAGYLRQDGLPEPRLEELTGDTKFEDVEDILDNLEEPPSAHEERYNVIAATNMISHGVDVDRFNYMVFFGMPRETAEYIQSSSRAGRRHPGTVLLCFNPARERDQSHYHLFEKYHEFLDRLVEPVPVNRWSKFSAKQTVPSILFGWFLNQWFYETGDNLYFGDKVSDLVRHIQAGEAGEVYGIDVDSREELYELFYRSYGSDLFGELPEAFAEKIRRELDRALTNLEKIETDMASEALNPSPMLSLRDIDEPIPFKPAGRSNARIFNTLSRR